jgi:hypothetical protein
MSLIMTYVGSKGCVMVGDKRRIGFLGDESQRELLEEELYSGEIKTKKDLLQRANQLQLKLNISNDAEKVRSIGDVLVGEVKHRTPFETKRKRIYATTNGYHLVELTGSKIEKVQSGKSSIVVFGNKISKKMANHAIESHWKSKINLKRIEEIFIKVMEDVAAVTPSVSPQYNALMTYPQIDHKKAMELIRNTIVKDVKELEAWRAQLKEKMLKKSRDIQMASLIINQGEVGRVKKVEADKIEVTISKGVEALDLNWNLLAREGDTIIMKMDQPTPLSQGDLVVIEDENLCIKKNKAGLSCDFILCQARNKQSR